MKKYIVVVFLFFCFCFLFTSNASAANLYSNNFTSSYSGFSENFGTCSTSSQGLTCTGVDAFYTTNFPTIKCVSADIDIHNIRDGIFLADGNYTSWIGLTASGSLTIGDGHLHAYDSTSVDIDLGVNTPPQGSFHNYKICKNSNIYSFYLDSSLIGTHTFSGHTGGYFGFEAKPGTIITNMIVSDSLPISLSVPLLKQTSNPWQSQLYDSANRWSPGKSTINTWGCALTAATMVMQYYGITKMPDNSPFNPAALNTWLKSQPDGYISVDKNSWGQVNWIALQRLSQIIKLAFNNPNYTADALELKYAPGANKAIVLSDLQNNQPDILEEPGHFVVATGTSGNTFTINDPYFSRNSLTNGYNDTFLNAIRLVPSHTDLSYILFVGPVGMDFSMQNSSGSAVGEEFIQQPLADPTNPSVLSGMPIKIFYFAQPDNDTYTLSVTNSIGSSYNAKAYVYDTTGNVQIFDFSGNGTQSNPDSYIVNFSKTNTHQDTLKKSSIFDSLLSDIQQLYQQNQIKKGTYNELVDEIKEIKNQYNKQHFLQEKIGLAELLIKLIVWNNNHTIPNSAYQTFVGDITFLLTH